MCVCVCVCVCVTKRFSDGPKDLIATIEREIIDSKKLGFPHILVALSLFSDHFPYNNIFLCCFLWLAITFNDIAGLKDAKRLLNEAIMLPFICVCDVMCVCVCVCVCMCVCVRCVCVCGLVFSLVFSLWYVCVCVCVWLYSRWMFSLSITRAH